MVALLATCRRDDVVPFGRCSEVVWLDQLAGEPSGVSESIVRFGAAARGHHARYLLGLTLEATQNDEKGSWQPSLDLRGKLDLQAVYVAPRIALVPNARPLLGNHCERNVRNFKATECGKVGYSHPSRDLWLHPVWCWVLQLTDTVSVPAHPQGEHLLRL